MKKIILFLLLAVVLVACGKKDDASSSNQAEEEVYHVSLRYKARSGTEQEKIFLEQNIGVRVNKYHTDDDVLLEEGVNKITGFNVSQDEVEYSNLRNMWHGSGVTDKDDQTIKNSYYINVSIEYNGNEPVKISGTIKDKNTNEEKELVINDVAKVKDIIERIIYKEYLPLQDENVIEENIPTYFTRKTYTTQASAEGNKQDVVYYVEYPGKNFGLPSYYSSSAFNKFIVTEQNNGNKILFYDIMYDRGSYSSGQYTYEIDRLYAVYKKDNKYYLKFLYSKNYGDDDTANFNKIFSSGRYINIDDILAKQ